MARKFVAPLLVVLSGAAACTQDQPITGPTADSPAQTSPVRVETNIAGPRVLVDASRDGGVWWFPQASPFSGTAAHQGKALAEAIRTLEYVVEELPRPFVITATLLRSYDIVIRANGFGTYTTAEISAYQEFVDKGGKLLLLADHGMYAPPDSIALRFGITFAGITRGDNMLTTFTTHAITAGLAPLFYMVGSGIVAQPSSAQILGRLSGGSYLDLDRNGAQDPGEPSAPAVLGAMAYGSGKVVFCGDTNLWQLVPQPLIRNVLAWFQG